MLIIGKNVKYAAKADVANAALTPGDLDVGSIGIYTIDTDGTYKLVIKGSATTGKVSSTTVKKGFLRLAQGLGNGQFIQSEYVDVKGIQKVIGSKYAAGSGQSIFIGYNNVTSEGEASFPVVNVKDEATIKLKRKKSGNFDFDYPVNYTVRVYPEDTPAEIFAKLVAEINKGNIGTASIVGVTLAAPTGLDATGSSTGGTIGAGTYYYKVTALNENGETIGSNQDSVTTTGTTSSVALTWNAVPGAVKYRVYKGTTTNAQNAYFETNTVGFTDIGSATVAGSVPAANTAFVGNNVGLKIVINNITDNYVVNLVGGFEESSVSYTATSAGSGTPAKIKQLEEYFMPYQGDLYSASAFDKHIPRSVDVSKTYDLYEIDAINVTADKTGQKATTDHPIEVFVAFEVQGDTAGTNQQADFEDIMVDIFPATEEISA